MLFPIIIFFMAIFIQLFGFFPDLKRGRPPLGTEAIPFFIQFGVISLVIGIIIIFLRFIKIKKIFSVGTEANGVITKVWKYRDSFRIYFSYRHKNLEFDNSILVKYNKKTKEFLPHRKIKVLFNEKRLGKATIKDIFE